MPYNPKILNPSFSHPPSSLHAIPATQKNANIAVLVLSSSPCSLCLCGERILNPQSSNPILFEKTSNNIPKSQFCGISTRGWPHTTHRQKKSVSIRAHSRFRIFVPLPSHKKTQTSLFFFSLLLRALCASILKESSIPNPQTQSCSKKHRTTFQNPNIVVFPLVVGPTTHRQKKSASIRAHSRFRIFVPLPSQKKSQTLLFLSSLLHRALCVSVVKESSIPQSSNPILFEKTSNNIPKSSTHGWPHHTPPEKIRVHSRPFAVQNFCTTPVTQKNANIAVLVFSSSPCSLCLCGERILNPQSSNPILFEKTSNNIPKSTHGWPHHTPPEKIRVHSRFRIFVPLPSHKKTQTSRFLSSLLHRALCVSVVKESSTPNPQTPSCPKKPRTTFQNPPLTVGPTTHRQKKSASIRAHSRFRIFVPLLSHKKTQTSRFLFSLLLRALCVSVVKGSSIPNPQTQSCSKKHRTIQILDHPLKQNLVPPRPQGNRLVTTPTIAFRSNQIRPRAFGGR